MALILGSCSTRWEERNYARVMLKIEILTFKRQELAWDRSMRRQKIERAKMNRLLILQFSLILSLFFEGIRLFLRGYKFQTL